MKLRRIKFVSVAVKLLIILFLSITSSLVYAFFTGVEPKALNVLARDWRSIEFVTRLANRDLDNEMRPLRFRNSYITFETQHFTSFSGQLPPPMSGESITLEPGKEQPLALVSGLVTLVDIESWSAETRYDESTAAYFLRLESLAQSNTVDFKAPFIDIPPVLASRIVFTSANYSSLILRTIISPTYGFQYELLPHLQVLADKRLQLDWNLEDDCSVSLQRIYDAESRRENIVSGAEYCSDRYSNLPSFTSTPISEMLPSLAQNTIPNFANNNPGWAASARGALVILPYGVAITGEGYSTIENRSPFSRTLIIAQATAKGAKESPIVEGATYIPSISAWPLRNTFSLQSYLEAAPSVEAFSTESGYTGTLYDTLMRLQPRSDEITLRGPIGRIATGLTSTSTDELSDVRLRYIGLPDFSMPTELVTTETGDEQLQRLLVGTGEVSSVKVNGEEVIPTRWESQGDEIKAAFIGGLIAIVTAFGAVFLERRRHPQSIAVGSGRSLHSAFSTEGSEAHHAESNVGKVNSTVPRATGLTWLFVVGLFVLSLLERIRNRRK